MGKFVLQGVLGGFLFSLFLTVPGLDWSLPPPAYASLEEFTGEITSIVVEENSKKIKIHVENNKDARTFYVAKEALTERGLAYLENKTITAKLFRRFYWLSSYRAWEIHKGRTIVLSFERSNELHPGNMKEYLVHWSLAFVFCFLIITVYLSYAKRIDKNT